MTTTPPTPLDIGALRRLLEAAGVDPAPWTIDVCALRPRVDGEDIMSPTGKVCTFEEADPPDPNAVLVCALRNAAPRLLDAAEIVAALMAIDCRYCDACENCGPATRRAWERAAPPAPPVASGALTAGLTEEEDRIIFAMRMDLHGLAEVPAARAKDISTVCRAALRLDAALATAEAQAREARERVGVLERALLGVIEYADDCHGEYDPDGDHRVAVLDGRRALAGTGRVQGYRVAGSWVATAPPCVAPPCVAPKGGRGRV